MAAAFIHPFIGFIEKTFVITEFELRKLRHDFTELVTRALQPALWLLIFGQVFSHSRAMHTGSCTGKSNPDPAGYGGCRPAARWRRSVEFHKVGLIARPSFQH
jgi:hypothetical protein